MSEPEGDRGQIEENFSAEYVEADTSMMELISSRLDSRSLSQIQAELDEEVRLSEANVADMQMEWSQQSAAPLSTKKLDLYPSGWNVFSEAPFCFFTVRQLDLISDFHYAADDKVSAAGSGIQDLCRLSKDPIQFVTFLNPEGLSVLVSNADDFKAICDYLFYCQVASSSRELRSLFKKALFDLLRNYKFNRSWELNLGRITDCLLNLGMPPAFFTNQYLDVVFKPEKAAAKPYHSFQTKSKRVRKRDLTLSVVKEEELDDAEHGITDWLQRARYACIKHFINLVSELMDNFGAYCSSLLVPRIRSLQKRCEPFILIHLLLTCAMDKTVVLDRPFHLNIKRMVALVLDSLNAKLFYGMGDGDPGSVAGAAKAIFFVGAYHCMSEHERHQLLKGEVSILTVPSHQVDFQLSVLHKLDVLLPHTYRALVVKRIVALAYLQTILQPGPLLFPTKADVTQLWLLLNSNIKSFFALYDDNCSMYYCWRLIDFVVADECLTDVDDEGHRASLSEIIQLLDHYKRHLIMKKNTINEDSNAVLVMEHLVIIEIKWQITFAMKKQN